MRVEERLTRYVVHGVPSAALDGFLDCVFERLDVAAAVLEGLAVLLNQISRVRDRRCRSRS